MFILFLFIFCSFPLLTNNKVFIPVGNIIKLGKLYVAVSYIHLSIFECALNYTHTHTHKHHAHTHTVVKVHTDEFYSVLFLSTQFFLLPLVLQFLWCHQLFDIFYGLQRRNKFSKSKRMLLSIKRENTVQRERSVSYTHRPVHVWVT